MWGAVWASIAGKDDVIPPFGFAMLFYVVALPIGIILGPPAPFMLAKAGRLACWNATLIGVIAGLIISALLRLPIPAYAPIGPAWALIFYMVWKLGPEPTDSSAINWVRGLYRRRS
jgi:hypothetical protein